MRKLIKYYKSFKQQFVTIVWSRDWAVEQRFLEKLTLDRAKKADNGLYDSIFQYRAQMFNATLIDRCVLQLMSIATFCIVIVQSLFRRTRRRSPRDIAYFYDLSIFTTEVKRDYTFGFIDATETKLTISDIAWLCIMLVKTRFNFVILSPTAFRVGQTRAAIKKFSIKEVWVSMEYSPACGLLYEYCRNRGLKVKNFMHGEKVLNLRDAFTRFDEFYVWNDYYKQIIYSLQANAKIVVQNPWILKEGKDKHQHTGKICYFLKGVETKREIEIIRQSLDALSAKGFDIYFKKHPRQHNIQSLSGDFKEFKDFKKNDISSLYQFDYIIAQFSTILFQGYCNGIAIIIDDVSNPTMTERLIDRKYIMYEIVNGQDVKKLSTYLC